MTNIIISIHAPLAGRDVFRQCEQPQSIDFNPRAPCGARRERKYFYGKTDKISIHAPLLQRFAARGYSQFQSTRPLRGATQGLLVGPHQVLFQSTRPLRGATVSRARRRHGPAISIHAPLAGRDSKFDEFLSANLHKSNKRDLLSEEKMRHSLPQTAHVSHFRSFFGAKLQRFSARLPFALRS